jgi:hypothetical protein
MNPFGSPTITILTAVISAITVSGCTYTHFISEDHSRAEGESLNYHQLDHKLRETFVEIDLVDSQVVFGTVSRVTTDSLLLIGDPSSIPTHKIVTIETIDHFSGAVGGFLGGSFGGLLVSGAMGAVLDSKSDDRRGLRIAMVALASAALGGVVGAYYGVVHGTVTRYYFPQPMESRSNLPRPQMEAP